MDFEDDETAARGPYKSWTIQDLKKELRRRNLTEDGQKSDLVNRLIANDTTIDGSVPYKCVPYKRWLKENLKVELRRRSLPDLV